MKKAISYSMLLLFFQNIAMDKLEADTLEAIKDVYDMSAFSQSRRIEEYFSCEKLTSFDDVTNLNAAQGQMEQGYQIIMTAEQPLKIRDKWGIYEFNNFSTGHISEEDLAAHIQKKFGAEIVEHQFSDQKKSKIFSLTKFDGVTFPKPIARAPQNFIKADEARHAFQVLSTQYDDAQALKELEQESKGDSVVNEWQPICRRNYASIDNVQPVYWIPYLGRLKSVMNRWYRWQ
jgi:hypothetical protein